MSHPSFHPASPGHLTSEQWAELGETRACLVRLLVNFAEIRVNLAALALNTLLDTAPRPGDPDHARHLFQELTDCRRGLIERPQLGEDARYALLLARLPGLLDTARELMGWRDDPAA